MFVDLSVLGFLTRHFVLLSTHARARPISPRAMSLRDEFIRHGVVVIPGAVPGDVVERCVAQLARDLEHPVVQPESGTPRGASLSDPSTWPSGTARRVIEVVAAEEGTHWRDVRESPKLREALDMILGEDAWTVEANVVDAERGICEPRHWYCPVTFPEGNEEAKAAALKAKAIVARAEQSEKRRKVSGASGLCTPAPAHWTECDSGNVRELRESGHDWEDIAKMISTSETIWTANDCKAHYEPAWAPEQDAQLMALVQAHGEKWQTIANAMSGQRPGCTKAQIRGRAMMLLDERSPNMTDDAHNVSVVGPTNVLDPGTSWHPVNRRRMLNRGWHLDIGAGFDTDWMRTPEGHPFQGAIILLFLTDCAPGGGGTAFIKGSHRWVASYLRKKGGVSHQNVNAWAIDLVGELSSKGRLPLSYEMDKHEAENAMSRDDIDGVIEQVSGQAGTIVLLHPWLIHSGTSNLTADVRLLANGMARVKQESFDAHGISVLKEVQALEPKLKRETDFLPSTCPDDQVKRAPPDNRLPKVSVICPVHNAARWIDETLASVCMQTYTGPIEVSIFDDSSSDGSASIIRRWAETFARIGIKCVANGSRWVESANFVKEDAPNQGIGFCRNRCIGQSTGEILVFLDSDDVMMPNRMELQVPLAVEHPTAIIGGCWKRYPSGSTEHYEAWANMMTRNELHFEQFRECTVLLPTWCMTRSIADAVGGFVEAAPGSGEAEDLIFFHRHLELHYAANLAANKPSLLRAGEYPDNPVLLYRWSPQSASARCSRRRLLQVRAEAFEKRILSTEGWSKFIIWGAGRDAKNFMNELSPAARARVQAMIDIDPRKTGRQYSNSQVPEQAPVPILHFSKVPRGLPVVVCVAKRRKGSGEEGDLESNVDTLGLIEGQTLWYFN